ncbi:site-2 protease family protein [Actinoplanes sp. NPDC049596]|uniref:site-2 protease family protein n=1 Tax=unclassified Actinoplanes TaxID=2626549 RepID=UPI003441198E
MATVRPRQAGGYAAAAGFAVLLLGSLFLHEYAHARVAQRHGIRVRSITLWMFGGVSELDGDPERPRAELAIALTGPAATGAVAGACLLAVGPAHSAEAGLLEAGFGWLAVMNLVLLLFNLLPAAPLDGGRVLAAVIWWMVGDHAAAHRAAAVSGVVFGSAMAIAGLLLCLTTGAFGGLWLILVGWFLAVSAHYERAADAAGGTAAPGRGPGRGPAVRSSDRR